MHLLFGRRWHIFDLKQGYRATIYINDMEVAMNEQRVNDVEDRKVQMQAELKALENRAPLTDEQYRALQTDPSVELTGKELYEHKKKIDGERAEQVTAMRNRLKQMDDEAASAFGELQKAYAIAYQNRVKYDFIRTYKPTKESYADQNK